MYNSAPMPVGFGFDIHRLVPGRRLVLGGVEIPHGLGLLGHSDGDVVLHALIDAILGAAGAGDIGSRFPDSDPRWAGISSEVLLAKVWDDLAGTHALVNADITVVAEEPKIAPHREAIRARIASRLGTDRVWIKGKTMEGLGPIGAGEAIAAYAVVELQRK
jgi:2-C-methyl-D-erythritol 2,4-cyclodiphosphate synthase